MGCSQESFCNNTAALLLEDPTRDAGQRQTSPEVEISWARFGGGEGGRRVMRKVSKCECWGLSNLKVTGKEEMCRFCLRRHNKAAEKDHGWWFPEPTNAVGHLAEGPGNVVVMSLGFAF